MQTCARQVISGRVRTSILVLVALFVLLQAWALYASTFHVLHNPGPQCAACVAIKNVDNSSLGLVAEIASSSVPFASDLVFSFTLFSFVLPGHHSRAPPFLSH